MSKTKIEWTEASWNPIGGCRKVSPGCKNCYAIRQARRMGSSPIVKIRDRYKGLTVAGPNWSGDTFIDEEVLREPRKTGKPTTYFISLSDLFYDKRPDEDIDRVFAVMALARWHKFLILTKYEQRMNAFVSALGEALAARFPAAWPLPNVALGVSVEDQQRADERIPLLLQTPAAVRFLSVEPLLGPVDLGLNRWVRLPRTVVSELPFPPIRYAFKGVYRAEGNPHGALAVRTEKGELLGIKPGEFERLPKLDWVIVGGESGPGARPCDVAWIRSIKDQCQAAGVACFVKQLGKLAVSAEEGRRMKLDASIILNLGDPKGGDMAEWPEDLRVRQYPAWLQEARRA